MHELSIALSILDCVAEEAQRHGRPRVVAVHLKLGPLCGVVKESLVSAFELAREQTPFATTRLLVEDVPLVAWCPSCSAERGVDVQQLCCPVCTTPTPEVVRGRELEVVALEIDS
jgi:hydrogenase nickel incorporation protein HypA/HybF